MEKDKLVWKKPKYNLREWITSLFKEKESVQIEKEARRQLLKETEERAQFTAELEQAHHSGHEKGSKQGGGLLKDTFKALTDLGGNVGTNMQKTGKQHRRSEPDTLLEGIL